MASERPLTITISDMEEGLDVVPSIFDATSGSCGLKDFSGSVWDVDAFWKHCFVGKWTDNKGKASSINAL